MSSIVHRPPRWSKRTDALVRHIAQSCRPSMQSELGAWIEASPRFGAFLSTHQDKVRKKFITSEDEDGRLDVRAELRVACLILADRRFELQFEAYGTGNVGPDLTATYRVNQRFNLEVTRLRVSGDPGERLANVIATKLRQLPGDIPNVLIIASAGLVLGPDTLADAVRSLKHHAEQKDATFFARRGLKDARSFYAQYLRLGGVFVLDEPAGASFLANREARRPLPSEALARLSQCLSPIEAG